MAGMDCDNPRIPTHRGAGQAKHVLRSYLNEVQHRRLLQIFESTWVIGAPAECSLPTVSAKRVNPTMTRGGHRGTGDARKRDQGDRFYICIRICNRLYHARSELWVGITVP